MGKDLKFVVCSLFCPSFLIRIQPNKPVKNNFQPRQIISSLFLFLQ